MTDGKPASQSDREDGSTIGEGESGSGESSPILADDLDRSATVAEGDGPSQPIILSPGSRIVGEDVPPSGILEDDDATVDYGDVFGLGLGLVEPPLVTGFNPRQTQEVHLRPEEPPRPDIPSEQLKFSTEATTPVMQWSEVVHEPDRQPDDESTDGPILAPMAPGRSVRGPGQLRVGSVPRTVLDVADRRWFWASVAGVIAAGLSAVLLVANLIPNPFVSTDGDVIADRTEEVDQAEPASPSTSTETSAEEAKAGSTAGAGGASDPTVADSTTTTVNSTTTARTPRRTTRRQPPVTTTPTTLTSTTASTTTTTASTTTTARPTTTRPTTTRPTTTTTAAPTTTTTEPTTTTTASTTSTTASTTTTTEPTTTTTTTTTEPTTTTTEPTTTTTASTTTTTTT